MMSSLREWALYHQEALDHVLRRLDEDLERGRHVRGLPEEVALAMVDNLSYVDDSCEDIQGEVAL